MLSTELVQPGAEMRRIFFFIIGFIACALSSSQMAISAAPERDYLSQISASIDTALVARIISAKIISTPKDGECFFEYESRITEVIRGTRMVNDKFVFYSDTGLAVGERYFIDFLQRWATTDRSGPTEPIFVDGKRQGTELRHQCAKLMDGDFLVYDQLHLVKYVERGKSAVMAVNFFDAGLHVPSAVVTREGEDFVDFDYVKESFAK